MDSVDTKMLSSLLLLPDTITIEAVYPTTTVLTVQVVCMLKNAACPLCQHPSERIHGSYGRTVADVPCGGRRVTLALTVRKFVCCTPECSRKIFTERLPALVQSYARMTNRLSEALQTLGLWGSGRTPGSQTGNGCFGSNAPSPHASRFHSPSPVRAHCGHRRLGLEKGPDVRHDCGGVR